ncbi:MAG: hypothetical protein QOD28_1597 [Acidobacteriota bacterium]|nr:hypothetical protein [Acidobacteriota bacterium]
MTLFVRDARWNSWRWRPILEKWGHLPVFINPNIPKTATFLIENGEPISTVFFVSVSLLPENNPLLGRAFYAITTKHSVLGDVSIRFNLTGGGVRDEPTLQGDWKPHPSTDLAILPLHFPLDEFDITWVDYSHIAEDRQYLVNWQKSADVTVRTHPFGVGDEVFTVGLFTAHTGKRQAQPVVRFGHIALTPAKGEKILAEIYEKPHELVPIDAFLVEISTWHGQSGSPVFLRPWIVDQRVIPKPWSELSFLIGMIQGTYFSEQAVKIDHQPAWVSGLNMGIGLVIPSYDIAEMLMSDELKQQRDDQMMGKEQRPKVRPSAASVRKEERPLTREVFEDALKRASRKTSAPDEETKGDEI